MICTPIGIGSSGTGTATTGRPMKEIGWVWMPILARTGSSTPSSTKFTCPSFGATQGVAGAMITSTDLEQLQHLRAIPAAEFLRAVDQRRRDHRARHQAIAHRRIEIVRALAQAIEMQRGAFGRGDDVGRGAGAGGFGNFDRSGGAERLGDARDGFDGLRENILLEIAAGDAIRRPPRSPARAATSPARSAASCRPHRRHRVPASRHRPARDRRRCARTGRDDRSLRQTETTARATAGHRSASGRRCRRTTTAPGSIRWCPTPARSAPDRRRPRRRSRPTSRRSSASDRADCATGRHARSRR